MFRMERFAAVQRPNHEALREMRHWCGARFYVKPVPNFLFMRYTHNRVPNPKAETLPEKPATEKLRHTDPRNSADMDVWVCMDRISHTANSLLIIPGRFFTSNLKS